MAKTFKASMDFTCWKQHRCVQCGCTYRYTMTRKLNAQGDSEAAAAANLAGRVESAAANDVDVVPCPGCGTVQPDMAAERQRPCYGWAVVLGLVGIGVSTGAGFTQSLPIAMASYVSAAFAAFGGLLVLVGSMRNPNGNVDANLRRAERLTDEGRLMLVESGSGDADGFGSGPPATFAPANLVGIVMFGFAAVATLTGVGLQRVNGWPTNENWYPTVAGPGDTSTFYMQRKIRSIKGYWRGGVQVAVLNPDVDANAARISGKTKSSSWGDTISGKSVSSESHRMWVTMSFPANEGFAGKTLDLAVEVNASFPEGEDGGFVNANAKFAEKASIRLGPSGAGSTYKTAWWAGALAACALIGMAGLGLYGAAGTLVAAAHPAEAIPLDDAADDEGRVDMAGGSSTETGDGDDETSTT